MRSAATPTFVDRGWQACQQLVATMAANLHVPLSTRPAERNEGVAVVLTHFTQCETCSGTELYRLSRYIGTERVELRLCRHCHAGSDLVTSIDRLTEDALAE